MARGAISRWSGSEEQSSNDFLKAIELDPTSAEAFYNLGTLKLVMGKPQEALESLSAAIKLDPNYIEAYGNRGNAYDALGEYKKAILEFDACINLDPSDMSAYFNRGNEYVRWSYDGWGTSIEKGGEVEQPVAWRELLS